MAHENSMNEYPVEDQQQCEPAQPSSADADESFCSADNMKALQVQVIGGTLNGYTIGFVAVYAFLFQVSTDCSLFKGEDACNSLSNAKCLWDQSSSTCGWKEFTCGSAYPGESAYDKCIGDPRCNWVYKQKVCKNPVGYASFKSGIFAGALILGAAIGSIYAGQFTSRVGYKVAFLIVGAVGVVTSVMCHVSAHTNEFWVLCAARLMIGVMIAVVAVCCPMYVDQNASKKYLKVLGVMFQVFTTFGIVFAAAVGLALGQSINYEKNGHLASRMQVVCAFATLVSVCMVIIALVVGDGKAKFSSNSDTKDEGAAGLDPNEYSYTQMMGRLLVGAVTAGTLQLTGINAVMNYAPTIMGRLGMEPMVGNFVVMLWNFVTTLVSIPLARVFTMRQLFLTGSLVTSLACLFLCGIPVYPDVATTSVKNGVAITGIAIFIAFFEFGVGPCFFVLAQDVFPPSFRPKGASFNVMVQYVFNIIINVCYPIVTEAISGGPSGDQDKGQAIVFMIFGCMGLVCFVIQIFFLTPWEEGSLDDHHRDGDVISTDISEHSPVEVNTPDEQQGSW